MSSSKFDSPNLPIKRRTFIRKTTVLTTGVAAFGALSRHSDAAGTPTMVNSIRSLSNPYHATWNQGGAAFARSIGAEYVTLVTEGNSEKGIADIRAIIEKTRGNMVLNVDPNDAPDARPIVDDCVKAGVYMTAQWTRPADLHPWDRNPYFVCYITYDNLKYGEATANELIKAIGGSGGIVALGGIPASDAATNRRAGLDKAIAANPGVKLLDFQIANWKSTDALPIVGAWLTRFGDQIKGIWCANDDMAVGALEALRAENLAGKVLVTGIDGIKLAIDGIRAGEFVATVSWDPYWQGSMGLSIAYGAKTGKFDPAKEPHEHREFYATGVLVTKENADEFYKTHIASEPKIDFNDYWGRVTGQVRQT
ncbi:MAG: sugar ABC transporter substrate-binding protein [Verrucomicrobia bacterium]|nr:sugar ABC transporter substrate-binding protein [Verrucomicrobiota bacterium]